MADDAKTLNEAGKSALAKGDLQSALDKFQQAAKPDPANPQIQFNIGLTFLRLGQPGKAIPHLQKAASDSSLTAETHYLTGVAYFESGDFAAAAVQLKNLEDAGHGEHVLFLLEESYRLTHQAPEARQAFHRLNTRYPNSPWVHYLMGNAFEHQADHDKAIAEYQAALARNPALPNAHFAIGYIYWKDRAFEAAKPWLEKELAVQPCHAPACYYLAETARTGGDPNAAIRLYHRAIECGDGSGKSHLGLGIVLSGLNRSQEAVSELERAIRLDPENATSHYRLALVYRKLGRNAEADAEYGRVKAIQAAGRQEAEEGLKPKP